MPNTLETVQALPDVSFTDNDTLELMQARLITNYEAEYERITEKRRSLSASDPIRILLYAVALDLFQLEQYVDRAGKQDLLKYSYGEFLDNLAAGRGVTRQEAGPAKTTVRFTLSEAKSYPVSIPSGVRVTNGDGVYFETTDYAEIPAGSLYADIEMTCTVDGIEGNDFVAGQIAELVDAVAYVESAVNIDTSSGGTDLETDESLAERVFLAPSSYSVAGSEDAYIYWVKTYNTDIGSVKVVSPEPCKVTIYPLMNDGSIPESSVLEGLAEFLEDGQIRPLSDRVTVTAPTAVAFTIQFTYYINRSDRSAAATIQTEVQNAVDDYIRWQTQEIGKDINPSELIKRVMAAGAKRVTVTAPVFTAVADNQVAQCNTEPAITYGGLEDD